MDVLQSSTLHWMIKKEILMNKYFRIGYTIGNDPAQVRTIIKSGENEDVAMANFLICMDAYSPLIVSIKAISKSSYMARTEPKAGFGSDRFGALLPQAS